MQLYDIISVLALLSAAQALPAAVPDSAAETALNTTDASLVRRLGANNGNSPANAIDMDLDCSNTPDTCDADAYAMLCLGAPRVLQRDTNKSHKRSHYSKSGARYQPFRTPANRASYGTSIPFTNWLSPEEFPFESANVENEAQRVVFLFPVPDIEQSRQGGALNRDYTIWHVNDGDWFHIRSFQNCNRPYCLAFNSNDNSVCRKKLPKGTTDFASFVWKRISAARKPLQFAFAGLVKRDVMEEDALIIGDAAIESVERRDVSEIAETVETIERRDGDDDPDFVGLTPTDNLPAPVVVQESWDDGVN